jgi:hypothetical protein
VAEDRAVGSAAWRIAVKAAVAFLPQPFRLGGVLGIRHALREFGQPVAGQLTPARQFKRKPDHARLLRAWQLFGFFDDAASRPASILVDEVAAFK